MYVRASVLDMSYVDFFKNDSRRLTPGGGAPILGGGMRRQWRDDAERPLKCRVVEVSKSYAIANDSMCLV
jgi:hypothetical protein